MRRRHVAIADEHVISERVQVYVKDARVIERVDHNDFYEDVLNLQIIGIGRHQVCNRRFGKSRFVVIAQKLRFPRRLCCASAVPDNATFVHAVRRSYHVSERLKALREDINRAVRRSGTVQDGFQTGKAYPAI